MDYVKETLQRQSAAWLALFGGSETASPETAEEGGEPSSVRRTETEERAAARAAVSGSAETALYAAAQRLTRDETAERPARDAWSETPAQERLTRERERLTERLNRAAAAWESAAADKAAKAAEGESLGAESVRWEAEAALREGRSDLETADARAISRRFERDARRYDGGFIFY